MERTNRSLQEKNTFPEKTSDLKWSGKLEFFISLVGYAIGISDVWRFPYLVYRNGGGAFLIPYLLVLFVCCLPMVFMETAIGQFSGRGTYLVWDFCPLFRGIGISYMIINLLAMVPASLLRCWLIEFIGHSFTSELPWISCQNDWNTPTCLGPEESRRVQHTFSLLLNSSSMAAYNMTPTLSSNLDNSFISKNETRRGLTASEEFYQYKILRISSGIEDFGELHWRYLIYLFVFRVIIFFFLVKSVRYIEKVMYVTTILPIVLSLVVWIKAMTLPGAVDGVRYLLKPDFSKLANPKVWIEASFMGFYTLGAAWGGFVVIGAHNKFHNDCYKFTVIAVVVDLFSSLLSGLVVFSVLGVMAAEIGGTVGDVVQSGLSLTFVTYPKAVTFLPVPQLWLVFFFLIILLVGTDAQMLLLETALCTIEEAFPLFQRRRPLLVGVMSVIIFVATVPLSFQNGVYIMQLTDWYVATFSVIVMALMECIALSWIYGPENLSRDIKMMLGRELPTFMRITVSFITPFFLTLLLVVSMVLYTPPNYGSYQYPGYARGIGWCLSMASVVPLFFAAGWELKTHKGPIMERLRKSCLPKPTWGPSPTEAHGVYDHDFGKLQGIKGKLRQNLFGVKTKDVKFSEELEHLQL